MKQSIIIKLVAVMMFFFFLDFHSVKAQGKENQPNGGEIVSSSSMCHITWNSKLRLNDEHVNLSLWDGIKAEWHIIAKDISPVQNSYDWNVPQTIYGDRFRIRIENLSTGRFEMTPTYFSIYSSKAKILENPANILNTLQVFPNPTRAAVTVQWKGKISMINIRNLLGLSVLTHGVKSNEESITLEIGSLPSGRYTLEINFLDGHEEQETLVIQK
jgi:hypothetical protein